jgi:hypothetical protein
MATLRSHGLPTAGAGGSASRNQVRPMATPPTFDYDYLRNLLREHPGWSTRQLAEAVTEHEREVRHDPGYGPIRPSAKSRYRDTWGEEGVAIPLLKRASTSRTQPWANVPREHWNDQRLDMLRILTRIDRGDPDIPEVRRKSAMNFARKLEDAGQVVDLRPSGQPYVRQARADELDQEGHIFQYHSRFPGLTEAQWKGLGNAEMRAVAAMRFMTDYQGPVAGVSRGEAST